MNSDIIHDLQSGALTVDDPQGAEMQRKSDLIKFKEVLKRKFLEGPGSNHTSLEEPIYGELRASLGPKSQV